MASKDPSVEFFLRAVQERLDTFKRHFAELISALALDDLDKKFSAVKVAHDSLQLLLSTVSKTDHPAWITDLEGQFRNYLKNHKDGATRTNFLQAILKAHPQVGAHSWSLGISPSRKPIDFDAIYAEFYEQSRLPDLFSELVAHLQKIVDSGQVDSVKALESLEKLIVTLKRNKGGSYFSTLATTRFARALFRNYLWEVLSTLPGLGPLLTAISKTLEEMDLEMGALHRNLQERIAQDAGGQVSLLEYRKDEAPGPGNE